MKVLRAFILSIFLLFVPRAYCVTDTFLRMKPDQRYMSFVLQKYLSWHEKHFTSSLPQMKERLGDFLPAIIGKIDHWLVPERSEFSQFLADFKSEAQNHIRHSFRFYIHPDLRQHLFLQELPLPKDFTPTFLEWIDGRKLCLLSPVLGASEYTLRRLCQTQPKSTFQDDGLEVLSRKITFSWPNPFPQLTEWELRTVKEGKVTSIFYFSPSTHPSRLPRGLDQVINRHGVEGALPLDKYSIDAEGGFTAHYP